MKKLYSLFLLLLSFCSNSISPNTPTNIESHYALLGLKQTASLKDVKKVCRDFKRKYDPDKAYTLSDQDKRAYKQKFEEYNYACAALESHFHDMWNTTPNSNGQQQEAEQETNDSSFQSTVVYLDDQYILHNVVRAKSHTPGCQSTEARNIRDDLSISQESRNDKIRQLEQRLLDIAKQIAKSRGASAIAPKNNYYWVDPKYDITEHACKELNRKYKEKLTQEILKDFDCECICK